MIKPHDRVDLLLHVIRNPAKGIPETRMLCLLQNVKVFAVNDVVDVSTEDGRRTSIKAATVSLVVTPQQAMKVSLAAEEGKLRLVPRSPIDDEAAEYASMTLNDILGEGPEAVDRSMDTPQESPPVEGGLLDLIRQQAQRAVEPGPEIRDMELVADEEDPGTGGKYWRLKEASFDAGFATAGDPGSGPANALVPPETGAEQGVAGEGADGEENAEEMPPEEMESDS